MDMWPLAFCSEVLLLPFFTAKGTFAVLDPVLQNTL